MDSLEAIEHFQKLNRTRVERLGKFLTVQQHSFLDLLPFLFHTNIEGLPGYVSKETPSGIADYRVDKATIALAQKLNPSLRYKQRALRSYPITGLYLVNHHGLLAIPEKPTFTVYLLHSAGLKNEQKQALEQKLLAIKHWAVSLDISLSTQLLAEDMLAIDHRALSLSNEQLDQFYLNGLVLAGAIPLWWLIPPEQSYADTALALLKQRLQTQSKVVDFGELSQASAAELTTSLSHLLDSNIENGLDAMLQLVYLNFQLDQFGATEWLSSLFKQGVYQGEYEPLYLDCRVLQLTQLESAKLDADSLLLARQSFYIQAEETLSKKTSQPKYPWRRRFLSELSESWQWTQRDFQTLDQRAEAHYQQCFDEHQQTHALFLAINKNLAEFSKHHQLALTQQNKCISLKLLHFGEHQPDVIDCLPRGLLARSPEEHLHLYRFGQDKDWKFSLIPLSDDQQKPLYQHASLLHLLAWAISNQLLNKATRIMIADKTNTVNVTTVVSTVQQLLKSIAPVASNSDALLQPAEFKNLLLFANLDQQPVNAFNQHGRQLSSLHNDPLNYANRGETLIASIDGLVFSSWGNWHSFRYTGTTSPLTMLCHLIPWWQTTNHIIGHRTWCSSETYGKLISDRISDIYKEVYTHFLSHDAADYMLAIAENYYRLHWQPGSFEFNIVPKKANLASLLAETKPHYSVSKLDQQLDPSGFYNELLKQQSPSQVTLFLTNKNQGSAAYLLDDSGSLISQAHLGLTESTLLSHFQRFLNGIQKQQAELKVRYIRVNQNFDNSWSNTLLSIPSTPSTHSYLPVTVEMENPKKTAQCTITCGPKQFTGTANDTSLFERVSAFMMSLRQSASRYPLYITEITFHNTSAVVTHDYIKQKQRLEKLLNSD